MQVENNYTVNYRKKEKANAIFTKLILNFYTVYDTEGAILSNRGTYASLRVSQTCRSCGFFCLSFSRSA